jgi:hypothetical protein
MIRTVIADITTVSVVERPTPSAPVSQPVVITTTANPKKIVLPIPTPAL